MKSVTLILAFLLVSSSLYAGSYNFECAAYRQDQGSKQIYKLSLTREKATLDNYPGVLFDNADPNIQLLEGEQTYVNKENSVVLKATVRTISEIVALNGNIGPREHNVAMNSVKILVNQNGKVERFIGSCTETVWN